MAGMTMLITEYTFSCSSSSSSSSIPCSLLWTAQHAMQTGRLILKTLSMWGTADLLKELEESRPSPTEEISIEIAVVKCQKSNVWLHLMLRISFQGKWQHSMSEIIFLTHRPRGLNIFWIYFLCILAITLVFNCLKNADVKYLEIY